MYKKKKIVVISMCVMILCMIIGYAALGTQLKINGTATIETKWEILFTKIEKIKTVGKASERITPTVNGTTATFHVDLIKPGDSMEYKITVENRGTFDAVIEDIQGLERGSEAVKFKLENIKKGDKLAKGTSTTFNVTVYFDSSITDNPEELDNNLTIEVKYSQDTGQNIPSETPVIKSTKLATRILQDNMAQSDSSIDFSKISSNTNGKGLYYTNKNTEGNKTTYYFRGAVENNYVSFAGFIWRIVRINEDGSVRLMKQDSIGASTFNDNIGDNTFVGYMHAKPTTYIDTVSKWASRNGWAGMYTNTTVKMGTGYTFDNKTGTYTLTNTINGKYISDYYGYYTCVFPRGGTTCSVMYKMNGAVDQPLDSNTPHYYWITEAEIHAGVFTTSYETSHKNEVNSTIKTKIDNWYKSNLTGYSSYLVDAGFCNDRSLQSGTGFGTNESSYGATRRNDNNKTPQFKCPNESRDLFTTSTSSKGNKSLTYPIGLLTADEVAYAGGVNGVANSTYYLKKSGSYWLMSPGRFLKFHIVENFYVRGEGSLNLVYANYTPQTYPVINLKANSEIASGEGTSSNPYVIS